MHEYHPPLGCEMKLIIQLCIYRVSQVFNSELLICCTYHIGTPIYIFVKWSLIYYVGPTSKQLGSRVLPMCITFVGIDLDIVRYRYIWYIGLYIMYLGLIIIHIKHVIFNKYLL